MSSLDHLMNPSIVIAADEGLALRPWEVETEKRNFLWNFLGRGSAGLLKNA